MPVELRKRKAVEPAPAPAPKKKNPVAKAAAKIKEAIVGSPAPKTNGSAASAATATPKVATPAGKKVAVGDSISIEGFGGEVETQDGVKTTLKKLLEDSKGGVVLFTYPKASTPGCTTQVCLFRDSYAPLTATGFSIFGLSTDSPKANTTFKTKQNLPYPLLCDPNATLIAAIGLKKSPKGTQRGVFVVDKSGKVLAAEPGGPAATVEVVKRIVGTAPAGAVKDVAAEEKIEHDAAKEDDEEKADTAAAVADTAEKIDGKVAVPA